MDMLGLKGSVGDDIGTTNMGHKECGDRNDRNKEYNQCYTGKTSIFFQLLAFGGYNHKKLYYMWHPCFLRYTVLR
jgi:hypothetical protein